MQDLLPIVPSAVAAAPELLEVALNRRERKAVEILLHTLLSNCHLGTRSSTLLKIGRGGRPLLACLIKEYPEAVAEVLDGGTDGVLRMDVCGDSESYLMNLPRSEEYVEFSSHWSPNSPFLFDNPKDNCPRLWTGYTRPSTDLHDGVDCAACVTRLPHVTTEQVLSALVACQHPSIMLNEHIRRPVTTFWSVSVLSEHSRRLCVPVCFHLTISRCAVRLPNKRYKYAYLPFLFGLLLHISYSVIFMLAHGRVRNMPSQSTFITLNVLLVLMTTRRARLEFIQLRKSGLRRYLRSVWNWLDIASNVAVYSCSLPYVFPYVLYLFGGEQPNTDELNGGLVLSLKAMTHMSLFVSLLFHMRGLEQTSFLVTMLGKVVKDLYGFAAIFVALWACFTYDAPCPLCVCMSTYSMYQHSINVQCCHRCIFASLGAYETWHDSGEYTFRAMIGDLAGLDLSREEGLFGAHSNELTVCFVLIVVSSVIILLNLIISLISETYSVVREKSDALMLMHRARLILEFFDFCSLERIQELERNTAFCHVLEPRYGTREVSGQREKIHEIWRSVENVMERLDAQHRETDARITRTEHALGVRLEKMSNDIHEAIAQVQRAPSD